MEFKDNLHTSYQKSIQAFLKAYPYSTRRLEEELNAFCRTCAMLIWNSTGMSAAQCTAFVNEIYVRQEFKPMFTQTQVDFALKELSRAHYVIEAPSFFNEIVEKDAKRGTNFSRKLIASLSLMCISFALYDGSIDACEADIIEGIQRPLIKTCDLHEISSFNEIVKPHDFVSAAKHSTSHSIDASAEIPLQPKSVNNHIARTAKNRVKEKSAMSELESLIGLAEVKCEIKQIVDFAKVQRIRKEKGLPTSYISYHLVFTGNPGTGKTTVARLVAQIYKELGVLSTGQLLEVSAKDLVAGYVGQTANKTYEVIQKSLGGVLFIDEAYSLLDNNGQGYGQEAVDTLF